jgi:DNA-binding transcriptional LysR family regulator
MVVIDLYDPIRVRFAHRKTMPAGAIAGRRHMELYQLRTFAAVAEEGHLTRAAERLHISQPAVSGQIKALERQFDLRLFERKATGMELTSAGRELLAHAQRVLAAAEALRHSARQLKGDITGTLRIGTVSDPQSIRVGELLKAAVRRHPGLELELHHEVSGIALESVRDGRLDASFYFGDHPGPGVAALPLRDFVYRVTGPVAWAERLQRADWADIAAMPWIVTPEISTHARLVAKLLADHGIDPPQSHIEADDERVIADLVRAGVGLSLMLEDVALAREASGEVAIWPKARVGTTLWFVRAADQENDPLLRALFELVRETWSLEAATPPNNDAATLDPDAVAAV